MRHIRTLLATLVLSILVYSPTVLAVSCVRLNKDARVCVGDLVHFVYQDNNYEGKIAKLLANGRAQIVFHNIPSLRLKEPASVWRCQGQYAQGVECLSPGICEGDWVTFRSLGIAYTGRANRLFANGMIKVSDPSLALYNVGWTHVKKATRCS
jgi:hypothetical protein